MSSKIIINLRVVKTQVENLIGLPISGTEMSAMTGISRTRLSQILNKPTISTSTDLIAKIIDCLYTKVIESGKEIPNLKKILLENLLSIEDLEDPH